VLIIERIDRMPPLVTQGFHHVTMVSADAQRTVSFYRDLLGLRLVKKTVNFDMPETYHLYFGDAAGSPGTLLTFFERPHSPRGRFGVGGIHHVALGVQDEAAQLKWKRRLTDHGVRVGGPYDRGYFTSIYFTDPDGQVLEMATEGPGFAIDEPADALGQELKIPDSSRLPGGRDEAQIAAQTHPEPVPEITPEMAISGIHHITGHTDDLDQANLFYSQALGLRLVKMSLNQDDEKTRHYFWANYDGQTVLPASDMTMFGWPPNAAKAREGTGQTHHVAFRAKDEAEETAWREHLESLGMHVTDIKDRKYFKSIYFHTHDGLLIELATDGPGFAVDEDPGALGESLCLPGWLEASRSEIEAGLTPLR
jgi:glyoxalase family protein